MERLTKRELPESPWRVEPAAVERTEFGYSGTAIERLAKFEDILEAVLEEQGRLGPKLEQMRIDGKTHSYQFKEMMGKKLMNAHLLALFKTHGIMDWERGLRFL